MQVAPGVLPRLELRVFQVTLLALIGFAAVPSAFSAPPVEQTTQGAPTTIPDLSGFDSDTRRTMEMACLSEKMNGPVAYGTCLNRQIASLKDSPGIPSLSGYDGETRRTMEMACLSEKMNGPVAYGACLNRQIAALKSSPGIPSLSGYDRETRRTMEMACLSEKMNGPVAYGACLDRQIASLHGSTDVTNRGGDENDARPATPPNSRSGEVKSDGSRSGTTAAHSTNAASRFTTENIMKVHPGMSSKQILEMFGAPKNVSQSVCGASVGKPWTCTTWEYGGFPDDWATFTFAGASGSLTLNNFDVHRR